MCSLQLCIMCKACQVIPYLFSSTLFLFCISLSKPALVRQMGTGRPSLFEKLQTCCISKCWIPGNGYIYTAVYLMCCGSEGNKCPFTDSVCRNTFLIQHSLGESLKHKKLLVLNIRIGCFTSCKQKILNTTFRVSMLHEAVPLLSLMFMANSKLYC